jgi:hypothetical protein
MFDGAAVINHAGASSTPHSHMRHKKYAEASFRVASPITVLLRRAESSNILTERFPLIYSYQANKTKNCTNKTLAANTIGPSPNDYLTRTAD